MAKMMTVWAVTFDGKRWLQDAVDRNGKATRPNEIRFEASEAKAIAARLNDKRDTGSEDSDETGMVSYVAR